MTYAEHMKTLMSAALLLVLASAAARAQINAGEQPADPNQPFTMTVSDATNAARAFRPKVVYPYHYRDSTGATTNAATFKQWLGTDTGIEVRLRKWY